MFFSPDVIYDLLLYTSSPAVLNSNLTFRATVTSEGRPVASETDFRFEWWDNHAVIDLPTYMTSKSPAVYKKLYSRNAGNYEMTVSLFYKNMSIFDQPLVKKVVPFFLTGE